MRYRSWRRWLRASTAEKIALGNGTDIIVLSSNYRFVRGHTVARAILGRISLFEPAVLDQFVLLGCVQNRAAKAYYWRFQ
jgi:hypothetical protein